MKDMQFIIEVEDIYVNYSKSSNDAPEHLYRIKGFNSLVFDEEGLSKLTSLHDFKLKLLTDIMQNFTKKHDEGSEK